MCSRRPGGPEGRRCPRGPMCQPGGDSEELRAFPETHRPAGETGRPNRPACAESRGRRSDVVASQRGEPSTGASTVNLPKEKKHPHQCSPSSSPNKQKVKKEEEEIVLDSRPGASATLIPDVSGKGITRKYSARGWRRRRPQQHPGKPETSSSLTLKGLIVTAKGLCLRDPRLDPRRKTHKTT